MHAGVGLQDAVKVGGEVGEHFSLGFDFSLNALDGFECALIGVQLREHEFMFTAQHGTVWALLGGVFGLLLGFHSGQVALGGGKIHGTYGLRM